MEQSLEIRFSADHATAAGHFPGNPIIPGAVLLDEILAAIAAAEGARGGVAQIRSAKFLYPVRPGETILVRWTRAGEGKVTFEGLLPGAERLVLTGTAQWRMRAP